MKEYYKNIGKHAIYALNGLDIEVIIMDVKQSYGNIRYEISVFHQRDINAPVKSIWVEIGSLKILE